MAGIGPPPKPAALRQRRNKVSGATTLPSEEEVADREVPELPTRKRWHAMTRAWWEDVWRSPMAGEFLEADKHRLYMLAVLVDQFWKKPNAKLMVEIRMQGQCFGLTPIDRRRLQWEAARGDEAERKRSRPKPPPRPDPSVDPRSVLQVVS